MVPSILLALTAIVLMVDVIVGIHRGFGFGLVRLSLWLVGTLLSMFFARSLTVWIFLKWEQEPNMSMFIFDEYRNWMGVHADTLGTSFACLRLSLAVSVVFVGLFLIAKAVTWVIYRILKSYIRKSAKKASAHNAAVDAVVSIKEKKIPKNVEDQLVKPYDYDLAAVAAQKEGEDKDFGTFGIYPKKDSEPDDEALDLMVAKDSGVRVEDGSQDSAEAVKAEEEQEEPEVLHKAADREVDGFESIAHSLNTGSDEEEEPLAEGKKRKPKKEHRHSHSLALFIIRDTLLSKILGGVLGFFMGLIAMAIITTPFIKIMNAVSDESVAESAVDLVVMFSQPEAKNLISEIFEEGSDPIVTSPTFFEIGSDFAFRKQDFVDTITSLDDSVIHYIFKYSGAEFIANLFHGNLSVITPESVGLKNVGIEKYELTETLKCYSEIVPDIDNLINTINERKGTTPDLMTNLEKTVEHLFSIGGEGEILTEFDKLRIANGIVDRFNDRIKEIAGEDSGIQPLEHFTDYTQVGKELKNTFLSMKALIAIGILK